MLRSKTLFATALLLLVAACGNVAGQRDSQSDACERVHTIGRTLLAGKGDSKVIGEAIASHIVSNHACYSPDLVATARIALARLRQPAYQPPDFGPLLRDG